MSRARAAVARDPSKTAWVLSAICLRPRYAMPSTDLTYGVTSQRARYAMSGTDLLYAATSST
eukprot:1628235-Rhodomonas_salina.1